MSIKDRSDDYTYPWGVPPNDVPEAIRTPENRERNMPEKYSINALVATEVMDWKLDDAGDGYWIEPGHREWLPDFISDIEQAWRIVDRLADLGHVITIKVDGKRSKERRYTIIGEAGRLGGDQASVCLAICDAALMIVGGYARS